jgi:tetratricopeptide (TPR) repeat protein
MPSSIEVNPLVSMYNAGRYAEAESLARSLLGRYPGFGFGWKLLGGALQMQRKDALPAFQKAADLMPADAEAHYNLGVVLKGAGRLEDAAASYRRAVKLKPDYAEAHSNLGNTLNDLGRHQEAIASYRHALKIRPDADTHNNLGTALKDLGQLDDAIASYRQAVALQPGFVLAHYNLGNALKGLGQLDAAVASYRKAVVLKPDFALAYYNLGNVLKELGQRDAAVFSYRRAIEIKPDFAKAHTNLGSVLKDLDQFEAAVASYRRALELRLDDAEAHANLGSVLQKFGQLDAAETNFRNALQINAECIGALLGIAHSCVVNGEMKKAEEVIKKVLEINPNYLKARLELASVRKTQAGDENLIALLAGKEAALNNQVTLSNQMVIQLNFALGKCFDDLSDYDQAFLHFMEGCQLKRATFKYDPEKQTQYFDDIMRIFNQTTIDRLRGGGDSSSLPIFVLGMPRSGTTLTEQIIASHPEVHGAGELSDLSMIAQQHVAGTGLGFPNNMLALNRADIGRWASDYVGRLQSRAPDARRITDKMPTNFFLIGLIYLMLPNAKIIHVNRNPIDTCLSCFMQLFNSGHAHTYDLSELGRYYVDYSRLMAHWRSVLPTGTFLEVQYEDVVADQETEARRIIDFCGMDWDDACIDFHKPNRPINTSSMMQVRQPIYKSSVERWRPYEKFLGPLLDMLGDLERK